MRINLLPAQVRERQRIRRQTGVVAAVGVIVLLALGGFYLLQQMRLNNIRRDLEEQRAVNADLQRQIAELQQFGQLEREVVATRTLLDRLLADEVRWSGVLRDISLVIPGDTWLTTLTGNLEPPEGAVVTAPPAPPAPGAPTPTPGAPATPGAPPVVVQPTGPSLVGSISFNGFGLSHRAVALWLTRLEDVEGFANPWLSSSTKSMIGQTEVVQFDSTVDLTELARVRATGAAP